MKTLFLMLLSISCAGLKTNHCSDTGAKEKAIELAKNLEAPGSRHRGFEGKVR